MVLTGHVWVSSYRAIAAIGTPNLEEVFHEAGFQLDAQYPEMVVLETLTYEKLWKLCSFVRAGYRYPCGYQLPYSRRLDA